MGHISPPLGTNTVIDATAGLMATNSLLGEITDGSSLDATGTWAAGEKLNTTMMTQAMSPIFIHTTFDRRIMFSFTYKFWSNHRTLWCKPCATRQTGGGPRGGELLMGSSSAA